MKRVRAVWYFIIYGVPEICVTKSPPEKNKRFIIRCAWLASKLTAITYKIRRKK